ncbi:hypothetical protein F8M49_21715 [Rhodococcus zopfii]|uniref:Transposase n=1 Tax=Rhodococcus zopfii TaxID=43772 RepID=A0ABU3WTK9_9NOCA|nr:hypothetical protein [Rhodococcus zopfii]
MVVYFPHLGGTAFVELEAYWTLHPALLGLRSRVRHRGRRAGKLTAEEQSGTILGALILYMAICDGLRKRG